MSDNDYAARIVEQGVGAKHKNDMGEGFWYRFDPELRAGVSATRFIEDPRVAMALMEKYKGSILISRMNYEDCFEWVVEPDKTAHAHQDGSLRRAITISILAALEESK